MSQALDAQAWERAYRVVCLTVVSSDMRALNFPQTRGSNMGSEVTCLNSTGWLPKKKKKRTPPPQKTQKTTGC